MASRAGLARIEWADAQMPVLRSIRERFASERPLAGVRVAACLHITAETANLVRTLVAGGAEVGAGAPPTRCPRRTTSSPRWAATSTCAARRGEDADAYVANVLALVEGAAAGHARRRRRPPDASSTTATRTGCPTCSAAPRRRPPGSCACARSRPRGGSAARCSRSTRRGTERLFNDHYGTGQSTLDGILRATNLLLAGKTFVVLGYGWTGKGIALRARGAGAQVIVCEVDPMRALEARMEGFEVMPALAAAERGDVFVTVTGSPRRARRASTSSA